MSTTQAQSFGEIRLDGQGNSVVINQTVVISADSVHVRPFIERSPYVGLRRFEEREHALFFGRDALIAKLLLAVRTHRFTLVAGASGSGKSSVVHAGLLPQLHRRLAALRVLKMVPDRDPFARLQAALLQAGYDLDQAAAAATVSDETLLSICTTLRGSEEPWLLFIDQFEEIFTLCSEQARRQAFLDGLVRLLESAPAEVKLVAAIRADFLDRFDPHPRLLELAHPLFFVTSPSDAELRQCIEQPAAQHGVTFEPGLVQEILGDLKGQPGALPLLQYTLDLLWAEDKPSDRVLNTEHYRKLDGISGALKMRADELYELRGVDRQRFRKEPRPPAQREALRRIFLGLLDLSDYGETARAISSRATLSELPVEDQRLVAELVDAKLLVTNRTAEGRTTVEVAHEALLTAWPRLQEWIKQAREVIHLRNRLLADAGIWDKMCTSAPDKADEEMWSGSRLQRAIELQEKGEFACILDGLRPRETAFLEASRALGTRREKAELARIEREAWLEGQREYARQSQLSLYVENGRRQLLASDWERALAWLIEAYKQGSTDTRLSWLLALARQEADRLLVTLRGHEKPLTGVRFSPDGKRVSTISEDFTARGWEVESGHPVDPPLDLWEALSRNVSRLSLNPDGILVAAADKDGVVSLWDLRSRQQMARFFVYGEPTISVSDLEKFSRERLQNLAADVRSKKKPEERWEFTREQQKSFAKEDLIRSELNRRQISTICFSPDCTRVITARAAGTVFLWDAQSGRLLFQLEGHEGAVTSACFSPDALVLATVGVDGTVLLWDLSRGLRVSALGGPAAEVTRVNFSPGGNLIVTASQDCTARLWEVAGGGLVASLQGHEQPLTSSSFSPDGARVLTASRDGTARLWQAPGGQFVASLRGHEAAVTDALFSPDSSCLVTVSEDSTARLWEGTGGRLLALLSGHEAAVTGVDFSSDGSRVVTISKDRTARLWNLHSGRWLMALHGHVGKFTSAAFSPDGARVITVADAHTARLWDACQGRLQATLSGHSGYINGAAFSPDGSRVVTTGGDQTARLWDVSTGQLLITLHGHDEPVTSACFSPDGTHLVTASSSHTTALLWSINDDHPMAVLSGCHESGITSLSFSPDGTRIVTASSDGTARLWTCPNGRIWATLRYESEPVEKAIFSPDGSRILTVGAGRTAWLCMATSGQKLIASFSHGEPITCASFSANGNLVVTASRDGTAHLWDTSSGQRNSSLRISNKSVTSACISPDGTLLVTASQDRLVQVWEIQSGQPLLALPEFKDSVTSAMFSPDGTRILTVSEGEPPSIWSVGDVRAYPLSGEGRQQAVQSLLQLARTRLHYRVAGTGLAAVQPEPDESHEL